jgi:hypothetical protein
VQTSDGSYLSGPTLRQFSLVLIVQQGGGAEVKKAIPEMLGLPDAHDDCEGEGITTSLVPDPAILDFSAEPGSKPILSWGTKDDSGASGKK